MAAAPTERVVTPVPEGMDPRQLTPWGKDVPLRKEFFEQLSLAERMNAGPPGSNTAPGAVNLKTHRKSKPVAKTLPVLEVYSHGAASPPSPSDQIAINFVMNPSPEDFAKGIRTGKVTGFTVPEKELALFSELIETNRKRLTPEYVSARESGVAAGVVCSVLCPIEATRPNEHRCAACGVVPVKPQWCSGCHKEAYCNKECQKQRWKGGHKTECAKKLPTVMALVDLTKQDALSAEFPDFSSRLMPVSGSNVAVGSRPSAKKDGKKGKGGANGKKAGVFPEHALGTDTVVKVQCGMHISSPCLVYDKTRAWELTIDGNNCTSGFEDLFHTIRTQGVIGRKGYFRAWIPKTNDGVLKISIDILPALPW